MIFHAVLCSIQWLKFLAWEEFDEEIWGEGLRPAYIENSIIFTPQFLKTLNLKLVIKHLVQGSWRWISELPALEMPFGGQFWGRQFWVHHSSELPALFIMFFCVDMTFNWFQMLFRVFCIVSVQDLYALEQFQSTRQQQQLRETQVEIDLDTRCWSSFKLHTSVDL